MVRAALLRLSGSDDPDANLPVTRAMVEQAVTGGAAFVLAPAQTGGHRASAGKTRKIHGHSMVVAPRGEILAETGTEPCITMVYLDMSRGAEARGRIPSLTHDRDLTGPE